MEETDVEVEHLIWSCSRCSGWSWTTGRLNLCLPLTVFVYLWLFIYFDCLFISLFVYSWLFLCLLLLFISDCVFVCLLWLWLFVCLPWLFVSSDCLFVYFNVYSDCLFAQTVCLLTLFVYLLWLFTLTLTACLFTLTLTVCLFTLFVYSAESQDSGYLYFCFRWLLIRFKREFSFQDVLRLWEVSLLFHGHKVKYWTLNTGPTFLIDKFEIHI